MIRQPTGPPTLTNQAETLDRFACPNPDCPRCNSFAAGNLRVVEAMGKHHHVRRLYCATCGQRFSEYQGTLLEYTKLPAVAVVRLLKCLMHGCSIEAAADICDVEPRTVERLLEAAGRRAEDFHRLQLDHLVSSPKAVQLDELHARVAAAVKKRGAGGPSGGQRRGRIGVRDAPGYISPWP
jgi:transposase-like protein